MALTTPVALTVVASGAAATLVSASYTPTANGIQFVFISATGSINGETLNSVASTHTGTGAWTIVPANTATASKVSAWIAWAITGSSPGSGTFTATFAAAGTDNELFVSETTGQDTVTPVNGTATAIDAVTATTPVLTLSAAPTTNDITAVVFTGRNVGANPGVPSGTGTFTSLAANNHVNPCASIIGAYRLSSTSTGITPSGMGTTANAGAALVIKAAASTAGAPVAPVRPRQKTLPRRRDNNAPQASQDMTPPAAPQRRKIVEVALRRRGRVMPARDQVNPPMPPTPVRLKRFAEKVTQRRNPTPVPAQVNPPIVSGFLPRPHRHPERLTPHRQAVVVPAQQTAAPNPPLPMPMARDRRIPARMIRHNQAIPVPAQVVAALVYPLQPSRVRKAWARLTRHGQTVPTPGSHAGVVHAAVRHRVVEAPARRRPGVQVPVEAASAPVPRRRALLARPSRRRQTLAAPSAVVLAPPVFVSQPSRKLRRPYSPKRRAVRVIHGNTTAPVASFAFMSSTTGTGPGMTGTTTAGGMTASSPTGPGMSGSSFPSGMTSTTGTTASMSGG